jgi:hypothetical protein
MSHCFAEDQQLWDESDTPLEHPYAIWTFSSNKLYIGDVPYSLSAEDEHRATFELGLFDVHFTHWKSRRKDKDDNRSYFYHTRLRSALEAHFREDTSGCLVCPQILRPWLLRTFFLCPQTPKGRDEFVKIATKNKILIDGSCPPLKLSSRGMWMSTSRFSSGSVRLIQIYTSLGNHTIDRP